MWFLYVDSACPSMELLIYSYMVTKAVLNGLSKNGGLMVLCPALGHPQGAQFVR